MTTTKACSKCGGKTKWRIEPFAIPTLDVKPSTLVGDQRAGQAAQTALPVAAGHPVQGKYSKVPMDVGTLCLEVCAACGYAELWAKGFEALSETEDGTVRKLEAPADGSGPYR